MSSINALILHYFFGIRTLLTERRGVTALEYGLIAALIAVAITVAVADVGTNIKSTFTLLSTKV